jgi:acetyl-CoA C-acetyltransferase
VGEVQKDQFVRKDTSLERLAKLKPVFERSEKGTLTAGNSTPLSDGASAVLLASPEWAKKHGHEVLSGLHFKGLGV